MRRRGPGNPTPPGEGRPRPVTGSRAPVARLPSPSVPKTAEGLVVVAAEAGARRRRPGWGRRGFWGGRRRMHNRLLRRRLPLRSGLLDSLRGGLFRRLLRGLLRRGLYCFLLLARGRNLLLGGFLLSLRLLRHDQSSRSLSKKRKSVGLHRRPGSRTKTTEPPFGSRPQTGALPKAAGAPEARADMVHR